MDEDGASDDAIGSILFDLQDIVDGKFKNLFFWKNIYGSPKGQSDSEHKKAMNLNPDIASMWKGRVLMEIVCEETEKPVAKIKDIPGEFISQSK